MISKRHTFENRNSLARNLADRVAQTLSRAISRKDFAVLAGTEVTFGSEESVR